MILTCPNCATRYFIPEDSLGPNGRTVRCTTCGTSWRETGEPPLDLTVADTPAPGDLPPAERPSAPPVHKSFRAKVEEQKRVREAARSGAVWAAIAGAFVLVIVAALVFRLDVVRAWPKSASAYAAIGMPVNLVGLNIEKVKAQPALSNGRAGLTVSGVVRNIRSQAVAAPALNVVLLDKTGKHVAAQITRLQDPDVPPGAARPFSATLLDPPSTASDVEVTFILSGKPAKLRAEHHPAREPSASVKLRPAEADAPPPSAPVAAPLNPTPAQPLPAHDPLALRSSR
jgi:predicted Zn finger-like uncharacterized protein